MYTSYACVIAWSLMCLELLQKKVLKEPSYEAFWRKPLHIFMIAVLPCIPVGYFGGKGYFGYGGLLPWCFYNKYAPKDVDAAAFYIPILCILFVGFCFLVTAKYQVLVNGKGLQVQNIQMNMSGELGTLCIYISKSI